MQWNTTHNISEYYSTKVINTDEYQIKSKLHNDVYNSI